MRRIKDIYNNIKGITLKGDSCHLSHLILKQQIKILSVIDYIIQPHHFLG